LSTAAAGDDEAGLLGVCRARYNGPEPMKTQLFTVLVTAILTFRPIFRRRAANDVINESLVKHWEITGDLMIAVAKLMPAG
jgi:hypothetical protein